MDIEIRAFTRRDVLEMIAIWNEVVEAGNAFPQMEPLNDESGLDFFESQSFTGVAFEQENGMIVGLYILHPNNIGRCGHISNASYAVRSDKQGNRIGEMLVLHSLTKAQELGFRILQFNAVVSTNAAALYLYKKLGFIQLGIIPKGFLMKDGSYQDIIPHYYML